MVIVFLEELNVSSVDHFQSDATLLEDTTARTADVEGGKTAPWQVHTHRLPSCPFLLLCSSLSLHPCSLSWEHTKQRGLRGGEKGEG